MADLINGVPRDQWGLWCKHGHHLLVADPNSTEPYPPAVPADPWPCDSPDCTPAAVEAEFTAEAESYECERWEEYRWLTT